MVIATDQTPNPTQNLSLEDFLRQPETKPASEFIHGVITQKTMSGTKHSRIQPKLANAIEQHTEDGQIASAFSELRYTFGERSLIPDITVIRWENLPWDDDETLTDRFLSYPDWTIEILSPDQSPSLVIEKIIFYLRQGTALGWLIDPYTEVITVFKKGQKPTIHLAQPINDEIDNFLPVLSGLDEW